MPARDARRAAGDGGVGHRRTLEVRLGDHAQDVERVGTGREVRAPALEPVEMGPSLGAAG